MCRLSSPACVKPVLAVAIPMAVALVMVSATLSVVVHRGEPSGVATVTVTATYVPTEIFGRVNRSMPLIAIASITAKASGDRLVFEAFLANSGEGGDRLIKAEAIYGNKIETCSLDRAIPGNYRGWITLEFDNRRLGATPGSSIDLRLYFEKSGTHTIRVVVSPGS